jgi:hypothetical protein
VGSSTPPEGLAFEFPEQKQPFPVDLFLESFYLSGSPLRMIPDFLNLIHLSVSSPIIDFLIQSSFDPGSIEVISLRLSLQV